MLCYCFARLGCELICIYVCFSCLFCVTLCFWGEVVDCILLIRLFDDFVFANLIYFVGLYVFICMICVRIGL